MTKSEYAEYEAHFRVFMEAEGITHLNTGHPTCPVCDAVWGDGDECPNGHGHVDTWNEPFVSSRPCDVCGDLCQGNREVAYGINASPDDCHIRGPYEICENCVYYAEYGRLDDRTMEGVEDDTGA